MLWLFEIFHPIDVRLRYHMTDFLGWNTHSSWHLPKVLYTMGLASSGVKTFFADVWAGSLVPLDRNGLARCLRFTGVNRKFYFE